MPPRPWPWDDSNTTDYAYVFHDGAVTIPHESVDWLLNMATRKNVQWGSQKGGILCFTLVISTFHQFLMLQKIW